MTTVPLLRLVSSLAVLVSSATAQLQFDELSKRHLPADSDGTYAVALGDVDGDGDQDLVCGNAYGQNRLYLNDGTGTFADATAARMPVDSDGTFALAFGDVDGDGDQDLVLGNGGQNRLYLNGGTGSFTDATATRMPPDSDNTSAVALGDVDADGDQDVVFGNGGYPGQQNRLYLNDGTGTFTDATAAQMPVDSDFTSAVALGDIDADGDQDLVFGNDGQNRLYLNDGTGSFTDATATRMPPDSDFTRAVALGDVDADGDADLVFGNNQQQNRLYLNDGTGTFTDATAARIPIDSDYTEAVALGDVDLDGDQDLVFGNGQQNRLYVNDGTGTFTDATAAWMPIDTDWTYAVALGDVDGDGDQDLVFGNGDFLFGQQNRLYLNHGTGAFADATAVRMPIDSDYTYAIALGDVDADGDPDLVYANCGQNRLYLNGGAGTFADATAARMPVDSDATSAVAVSDVDGDGDQDLVFGNGLGQQDRLYLNDGTGTFTDATAARMPVDTDNTSDVALGDVDGDGDQDLVFGNGDFFLGQNRLYLNDGTGTFTDVTAARMPIVLDNTYAMALGDVDGDGDQDLVCGNGLHASWPYHGGQNRLYVNDGTGTFTDATAACLPSNKNDTRAVAFADVDGDGDPDLLYGNSSTSPATHCSRGYCVLLNGQNRLYLNDGTGTFTDATAARMPVDSDDTYAVALADVDGDGDRDLVCGNGKPPFGGQNRLYLNLLRQVDVPLLVRPGYSYQLDAYARYGPSRLVDVVVPFVSTATARIPSPPFGTFGLAPNLMVALPAFVIPPWAGVHSVSVPVPDAPSLVGVSLYAQALLVQYPTLAQLTNVTADQIMR